MITGSIKTTPNGYKFRLTQIDDSGQVIQYVQSAGTHRTRENAMIALVGFFKELSDHCKEHEQ